MKKEIKRYINLYENIGCSQAYVTKMDAIKATEGNSYNLISTIELVGSYDVPEPTIEITESRLREAVYKVGDSYIDGNKHVSEAIIQELFGKD